MTQTEQHTSSSLVVPHQVENSFAAEILPKVQSPKEEAYAEKWGKARYFARKSSLLTGSAVMTGSIIAGMETISLSNLGVGAPSLSLFLLQMICVSGSLAGAIAASFGGLSIIDGSRSYAPLPASKRYLAEYATKQRSIIKPFEDWDKVFTKNVKQLESGR